MRVDELLLLELGKGEILGALNLTEAVLLACISLVIEVQPMENDKLLTDSSQLHVNGAPISHSVEG